MITGNHKDELRITHYTVEFAFCEFFVNEDGTKRPNEWTPPLHKISTNDIELLWLYWERAEIEYNSIKYNLDNVFPDTSIEAKEHYSRKVNLTDENKRIESNYIMVSRQTAIDAYYAYKEYLQGIRGKIQIAQRGKGAPDLPDFTDYEYDAYYLPKPTTATQTEAIQPEAPEQLKPERHAVEQSRIAKAAYFFYYYGLTEKGYSYTEYASWIFEHCDVILKKTRNLSTPDKLAKQIKDMMSDEVKRGKQHTVRKEIAILKQLPPLESALKLTQKP